MSLLTFLFYCADGHYIKNEYCGIILMREGQCSWIDGGFFFCEDASIFSFSPKDKFIKSFLWSKYIRG